MNIKKNTNKYPIYGVIKKSIDHKTHQDFLKEIEEKKIKVDANIKSGKQNIRKVDAWRIPVNSLIGEKIKEIAFELNKTFNYKLTDVQDIQYLEYKSGDYYDWHVDIADDISSKRKISISYILNSDFEGGELEFFHGGNNYLINEKKDQLIAFTSFMNHRVKKVTKGVRKALVIWINGDPWQ